MFYLIIFLLALVISMVIINALFLNKYHNFVIFSQKVFETLTFYYYSIPVAFNLIRRTLISKSLPTKVLTDFVGSIHSAKDEKEKLRSARKIKNFANLNKVSEHASYATDNPKVDLNFLCNGNELCIKTMKISNGYCSLGVILGADLENF